MADDKILGAGATRSGMADLPVRLLSAAVMIALLVVALLLGGPALDAAIYLVALVGFVEFARLVLKATPNLLIRAAALVAGALYFGCAASILAGAGTFLLILVLGVTIATDTGAFFTGRAIGGPKVAPSISPSKTWTGLIGGMAASAIWVFAWVFAIDGPLNSWVGPRFELGLNLSFQNMFGAVLLGAGLAVVAQVGDFAESWLKRRAGVKDSSNLIPGHGGILDRIDGLIPVAIVAGYIAIEMVA